MGMFNLNYYNCLSSIILKMLHEHPTEMFQRYNEQQRCQKVCSFHKYLFIALFNMLIVSEFFL